MAGTITIALDAMGGDYGPSVVIPAAARAYEQNPRIRFLFYGDQVQINQYMDQHTELRVVSDIHHTDKVISNDENINKEKTIELAQLIIKEKLK
jgi:glycerol-3-phosphate acyltransferase PlsX